jgi:hypothetical protein
MRRSTHGWRAFAAAGAGALLAGGLAAAPAIATVPPTSVMVLLKAPDQAGLNRLAVAQDLTHAQRVAALAKLIPTATTHRTVAHRLEAAGFQVTGETAWTVSATAASTTVEATFGTPDTATGDTAAARLRTAATLPTVPADISSLSQSVITTTGGPSLFQPADACSAQCHSGNDFRNAYTAPKVTPPTGVDPNGPLTVATLQFAGWNPSDLTKYAAKAHLPDPVASGQYTQVPVDQASVPNATKGEHEADEEVDLDQESLLSTAPNANQRAYFAPLSTAGNYLAELNKVLADVTQSSQAYKGGDPKIAAVSTSWGSCESEFKYAFSRNSFTGLENVMKSLTAAGVTMFAASGDDGVYDCGDSARSSKIATDYPASSPEVVSVGGTRLKSVGSRTANTGHNWSDTAWSCNSTERCEGLKASDTGGSGGGESSLFALPAYQKAGIGSQPFTTATGKKGNFGTQPHRLVPDIAANGDPASGFEVLTTDPSDVPGCPHSLKGACTPASLVIGGTSLSSPVSAGLFTNMLAAHGATAGVGDIHAALYSAYAAHKGVFRDVRSGVNGHQADVDNRAGNGRAYELPVNAQKGYDTVSGLGTPLWPRLAPYLFAPAAPNGTATLKLADPHTKHFRMITASWKGQQASHGGSAPSSATVTITREGSSSPIYRKAAAAPTGSHTFRGVAGGNYLLSVTEHDLADQSAAAPATSLLLLPYDDTHFTFHGKWTEVAGASDIGGSVATSQAPGATANVTASGAAYQLSVRTGPAYGTLAVYHGGALLNTYDLYAAKAGHVRLAIYGGATTVRKARTFRFRYTGRKNALSTAKTINLDALYVCHQAGCV